MKSDPLAARPIDDTFMSCFSCKACDGAHYQMAPMLVSGNAVNPAILVIAQNPGEIHEDDKLRDKLVTMSLSPNFTSSAPALKALYDIDFGTSPMQTKIAGVFGEGWLESGRFAYTNAVRCRTPKNAHPSDEMVNNCSVWTKLVVNALKPKGIVLLGSVAFSQLFPKAEKEAIAVGEVKRHKTFGPILRLHHPSAWRFEDMFELQEKFHSFDERIK